LSANLISVIALSAIFAEVTARFTIFAVSTEVSAIFTPVTALSLSSSVPTESLGTASSLSLSCVCIAECTPANCWILG
jgi:hypothetical protein